MKLTIYKYIANEIWPTFFACIFIAVFIAIATEMLSITEVMVTQGVTIMQIVMMIVYLLPDIIVFSLPAASLMAVVVAFLRLSADSEIIALRSSGISLYQMLFPVIALSGLGFVIAMVIGSIGVPWGNSSYKDLLFQIAESKSNLGIKPHVFCEPFDNVVFYVNGFSNRERTMEDVFVADKRNSEVTNTVIAKEGRIILHPQNKVITLHFEKGVIFIDEKKAHTSSSVVFDTSYDINIGLKDIMATLAKRRKRPKEMKVDELIKELSSENKGTVRYNEMLIELLEKLSLPLAVFIMGIIGAPLGAHMKAKGRSAGIGISLIIFLMYYLCLAGVRSICETGALSPLIGVWIPDIFLIVSCVYFLGHGAREYSMGFFNLYFFKKKEV